MTSDTRDLNISLVIPAYNEENYIADCLSHAIESSRGRFFEIIVIDNASTDRTREIAEAISGVRVVREEKKGITKARQRGLDEARGDIIAFIDADTRMPLGWYEAISEEFTKDPRLACLSGPYLYFDIPLFQQFLVKLYWYLLAMPAYIMIGYMSVGGNFAIRRDVLLSMGGFDTTIAFYGEDTNTARRAHQYGKVKFSPRFVMQTSGRRLSGQGAFTTMILYVTNFLSEVLFHRSVTKEYKDIR